MYKYCILSILLWSCSFMPIGYLFLLFSFLSLLYIVRTRFLIPEIVPSVAAVLPVLSAEKKLQQTILKLTRSISIESDLINALMDIIKTAEVPLNIIHVSTVLHCIGKFGESRNHPFWPLFISQAAKLVASERINIRRAIYVIAFLRDANMSVEEFVLSNKFTPALAIQLLSATVDMPISKTTLIEAYLGGKTIRLIDLQTLTLAGFQLDHASLEFLPNELPVLGIHRLLTDDETLARRVIDRLPIDFEITLLPISDLIAISKYLENSEIWFELATRFCFLPGCFVRDVFSTIVHSTETAAAIATSLGSEAAINPVRVIQGLRIIVGAGLKPEKALLNSLESKFSDSIDILFYISTIQKVSVPATLVSKTPDERLRLLILDPKKRVYEGKASIHVALVFLAVTSPREAIWKEVTKQLAGVIDRFVPRSVTDALNWLAVVSIRRGVSFKKIRDALKVISSLEKGKFAIGLEVAKQIISFDPIIEQFVLSQVEFVDSNEELIDILKLVKDDTVVVNRIIGLIQKNTIEIDQIVTILSILAQSGSNERLDPLFQALQEWLVPRIPKLNIVEIEQITEILEIFEKHDVNTPSGVSTCSD